MTKLSVESICSAAGLSRTTFYHYYGSKFAPVVALVEEILDGYYESLRPFHGRDHDGAALPHGAAALRQSLASAVHLWSNHDALMAACVEHWHEVDELRNVWLELIGKITDAISAEIDRERADGLAPPGPPSRALAASLIWSSERCLYVAFSGADRDIASVDEALECLVAMWGGAVYGVRREL